MRRQDEPHRTQEAKRLGDVFDDVDKGDDVERPSAGVGKRALVDGHAALRCLPLQPARGLQPFGLVPHVLRLGDQDARSRADVQEAPVRLVAAHPLQDLAELEPALRATGLVGLVFELLVEMSDVVEVRALQEPAVRALVDGGGHAVVGVGDREGAAVERSRVIGGLAQCEPPAPAHPAVPVLQRARLAHGLGVHRLSTSRPSSSRYSAGR